MRNLFITVEDEEVQSMEDMEEGRNTEPHTPAALGQSKKPLNREEGQHFETSP